MKTSLPSMLLVLLVNLSIGTCMEATPAQPPEWLYHYTSKANFLKIMEREQLKPSNVGLGGPGVYFTELSPDSPDDALLGNNYDGQLGGRANNVEYAVGIRQKDLQHCKKLEGRGARGRNIWMIQAQNDPYLQTPEKAPLPIDKLQYKTFRRGDGNSAGQAFKAEPEIKVRSLERENRQMQQRITDIMQQRITDIEKLVPGDDEYQQWKCSVCGKQDSGLMQLYVAPNHKTRSDNFGRDGYGALCPSCPVTHWYCNDWQRVTDRTAGLKTGDSVQVVEELKSNDNTKVTLKMGLRGTVIRLDDKTGSACIDWVGIDERKWVWKENFYKLRRMAKSSNSSVFQKHIVPTCVAEALYHYVYAIMLLFLIWLLANYLTYKMNQSLPY